MSIYFNISERIQPEASLEFHPGIPDYTFLASELNPALTQLKMKMLLNVYSGQSAYYT